MCKPCFDGMIFFHSFDVGVLRVFNIVHCLFLKQNETKTKIYHWPTIIIWALHIRAIHCVFPLSSHLKMNVCLCAVHCMHIAYTKLHVSCTGSFYIFYYILTAYSLYPKTHTQQKCIYRLVYSISNDQIPHCTMQAMFIFISSLSQCVSKRWIWILCLCFYAEYGCSSGRRHRRYTIATYIYILMIVFVIKIASEFLTIFSVATNATTTTSFFLLKSTVQSVALWACN